MKVCCYFFKLPKIGTHFQSVNWSFSELWARYTTRRHEQINRFPAAMLFPIPYTCTHKHDWPSHTKDVSIHYYKISFAVQCHSINFSVSPLKAYNHRIITRHLYKNKLPLLQPIFSFSLSLYEFVSVSSLSHKHAFIADLLLFLWVWCVSEHLHLNRVLTALEHLYDDQKHSRAPMDYQHL